MTADEQRLMNEALWRAVVDLIWADDHSSDEAEHAAAVQSAIKHARIAHQALTAAGRVAA